MHRCKNKLNVELRNFTKFFMENLKGRDSAEELRQRLDDNNIRMDLREIGWEFVD
jgi:predicted helicase